MSLVNSAEEQLKKALILDLEFERAKKTSGILERKKKEILSLIDTIKF